MKFKKLDRNNIIFLIVIAIFIIPQTRQPIQILLHKGMKYINQSSLIDSEDRTTIAYSNWELISDVNTTLNFRDTEGKVVFINFWATWCPPCIAEMPSLQALYNDYNDIEKDTHIICKTDLASWHPDINIKIAISEKSKNGVKYQELTSF